ncbi:YvrJ family protein [Bacillus sp. CGMCC 1.16541]|nr:YvrJ family protein [Bacillus sp. CGMCC 1.16541]
MMNVDWVNLVGNVGFPIVVTFYLLMRIETRVKELEQAVEELANDMRKKE